MVLIRDCGRQKKVNIENGTILKTIQWITIEEMEKESESSFMQLTSKLKIKLSATDLKER